MIVLALSLLMLSSCSYSYRIKAEVIGGKIAFVVDPKGREPASCITRIEVIAQDGAKAKPAAGDAVDRMDYGTFWFESLDYDCIDNFPIFYGQNFRSPRRLSGEAIEIVTAKTLKIGVVYEVSTTSGATGYGSGAFKILPNRTVLNVPVPSMLAVENVLESSSDNGN